MTDDSIDKGLAEAFGNRDDGSAIPAPSVLRILQAKSPSVRAVHLDSPSVDDAPVKVTDEAKQLRDPSGRYQLLGEIGRGGIGTVYKGRDQDLGRDVAMKVLKDEFATREDVLARFVEEAQIGGQLQHPGIVPVYELGLQAGERPYFAMKLVKGETLAVHLSRRDVIEDNRRKWLGVFEQVCQTMAYAHARRVVHRDLKPTNIMIGAFGEVQVVDWGFAKVLPKGGVADEEEAAQRATEASVIETVRSKEGSGTSSLAGSMLGTPAYMPPEQALGEVGRVDQRSDVFALGAILCELLTGVPPYRERDGDVVRQAANAALDGAHERLGKCGADAALVQLCKECLSPSKRARPESAREVADRIGGYLTSVEERAQKAEVRAAEVRFRHRITLVAATAVLLLVTLGGGSWVYLQQQAQTRRAEVTQQVAAAMNVASRALGTAQSQGEAKIDVTLWGAADASAESLALLLASDDVEVEVRRQAEALLSQVERDSRSARAAAARQDQDAAMVARLDDLLIPTEDDPREVGFLERDLRRLDEGYAQAFVEHLRAESVFELAVERAVEALQGAIAVDLAVAIDRWGLIRDARSRLGDEIDADRTRHLRAVAARLDDEHAWRARLRALLPRAADEAAALLVLADEAEQATRTAAEYRVLAQALQQAGRRDRSVALLEHARRTYPEDFGVCFELAFGYEVAETPNLEQAQQTYRIANAIDAQHDEVRHRRGVALAELGRWADAARIFKTLTDRDPDNHHWLRHWADAMHKLDRKDEAIACYRRLLTMAGGTANDFAHLGVVFGEMGLLDEAIAGAERATAIDSQYAIAWFNLGTLQVRKRDFADAETCFRRVLELDDQFARANYYLAQTLEALGKTGEAIDRYQLETERNPSNLKAYMHHALLLVAGGRRGAAIDVYRRAVTVDGNHPGVRVNLAIALERHGELTDAIAEYATVARMLDGDTSPFGQRWLSYAREHLAVLKSAVEVLAGRRVAQSSAEWSAVICALYHQRRYAEVVAWTEEAQLAASDLTGGGGTGLYYAACAAAQQAAHGERAGARELALSWLARYVEPCGAWIEAGGEQREEARKRLRLVLEAGDFGSVRGDALKSLPEAERAAWQQFWTDVASALANDGR